jgi:hypothetical protein
MMDAAGPAWMGQAAEQLKERVEAVETLKTHVENLDITDPDQFAALLTKSQIAYMGSIEDFPLITYHAVALCMKLINKADEIDPELAMACRGAFTTAMIEHNPQLKEEVTRNENDNCNVSH